MNLFAIHQTARMTIALENWPDHRLKCQAVIKRIAWVHTYSDNHVIFCSLSHTLSKATKYHGLSTSPRLYIRHAKLALCLDDGFRLCLHNLDRQFFCYLFLWNPQFIDMNMCLCNLQAFLKATLLTVHSPKIMITQLCHRILMIPSHYYRPHASQKVQLC